ncbi:hypothetical protein [Nissabacter sp. SGAir0207]|uniref:hypothetical protein n=1 Tax=Nissabacter sp. SGAir0207 TaxID=2126321 RepID=UPI0010CD28C1|nr:hypothetical protein [Nissabacter sp. SGAir0207]QCR34718.1 hypothetical protein C1N62_00760 [Nissabacter sp. SGAir0207]
MKRERLFLFIQRLLSLSLLLLVVSIGGRQMWRELTTPRMQALHSACAPHHAPHNHSPSSP